MRTKFGSQKVYWISHKHLQLSSKEFIVLFWPVGTSTHMSMYIHRHRYANNKRESLKKIRKPSISCFEVQLIVVEHSCLTVL